MVENVETMSVEMYPGLNEQLYLWCHGKKCESELEIYLSRPIPEAYGTYVRYFADKNTHNYC